MSNGNPAPFPVSVNCVNGQTQANPPVLPVQYAGTGKTITVVWNAVGTNTFPSTGAFSWKNSTNPGINPTVTSSQLTLTYPAPASPVIWAYNIKLNNCTQQDPEIDNGTPPGDEDDDKDKGKDKNR